jgi:signal transduction histidine kinase
MVFGSKPNHQMYTSDDVLVFETLSYSTSLAIENCRFWREIEDRQRKARLEEMDTYSYSLAHEIDNPVQIILGHAGHLKKGILRDVIDEAKRKDLEESSDFVLEAAKRIASMVEAIRGFGQKTTGEFKALDIEDVVAMFCRVNQPKFKEKLVLFGKASNLKEKVFVRGERPQLMQVLTIFANNSIHAVMDLKEKRITLRLDNVNHDWVKISFIDNGYGIKKEMLSVIFTQFVTTKASTEGTGMGLYNAKKIVEHHKGRIWAESDGPGKGSTFIIELPIANDIKPEEFEKKDKDKGSRLF